MSVREFQRMLRKKGIAAAILYNMETNRENINIRYLANYSGYGFLVVPAAKKPFLIIPLLDIEYALKSGTRFHLLKKDFMDKISKKIGKAGKIGIEAGRFSVYAQKKFKKKFRKSTFVDISEILSELRAVKTKKEIGIIREAAAITARILNSCIRNFRRFSTERDVYDYLRIECIRNNVEPSFDFVVASGRSPATPHHVPQKKRLSRGFCVIDFGIRHKGYCTDVTRTLYIGKPSRKEREIYELVLSAQKNTISRITAGMKFSELDRQARNELGKYKKKFIHALGHGIGLEVHELPSVSPSSREIVREGMCFTIEPGVYFPLRFGIRIEDDILIRGKKPVLLTGSIPKNFRAVKPKHF